MAELLQELGADGFNGDTMEGETELGCHGNAIVAHNTIWCQRSGAARVFHRGVEARRTDCDRAGARRRPGARVVHKDVMGLLDTLSFT